MRCRRLLQCVTDAKWLGSVVAQSLPGPAAAGSAQQNAIMG